MAANHNIPSHLLVDDPAFDLVIDRTRSSSTKWLKHQGQDKLPLWVADMDFKSPPAVLAALHERVEHGIFGYTEVSERLVELIIERLSSYNNWQVDPKWLVWLAAVVPGLNMAAHTVGEPGDAIVMPVPVYHPFLAVPAHAGRAHVPVRLAQDGDKWVMDLDAIDAALVRTKAKLVVICNPQNPTGRVYRKAELEALAEIVLRRDAIICSDEIHCDLIVQPGLKHTPIASLSPEVADKTITLLAPTKTFNMPGLNFAFAVISNPELRQKYRNSRSGMQPAISPFALVAAEAGYASGGDWLQRLLVYLRGNAQMVQATVAALPNVQMTPVEATCLAWLDVRACELPDPATHFERYGIGLSDGRQFDGAGFVRLNFGCPRTTLQLGLDRLQEAVRQSHVA